MLYPKLFLFLIHTFLFQGMPFPGPGMVHATASTPKWLTEKCFTFRSTAGFVTDPTNCVFVDPAGAAGSGGYPTTSTIGGDSVTYGWESTLTGLNRLNSVTNKRLAGFAFPPDGTTIKFRVDLNATGSYSINAGFGDPTAGWNVAAQLWDNASNVFTIAADVAVSTGQFMDATGVIRTSESDYNTNQAAKTLSWGSTVFKIGTGDAGSTIAPIDYVTLTQN